MSYKNVRQDFLTAKKKFQKAKDNAREFLKKYFPEGTKFDLGNHRYRVIAQETNEHRNFGLDIKNVRNHSTRPIDLEKEFDDIENIEPPNK